jgi:DNA-binding MarR family transcriptional regulator
MSTVPTTTAANAIGEPLAFDSAAFDAWRGLIFSSSRLLSALDEELRSAHNFTLGEFDVLRALKTAPDQRRRMCDLAASVVLTASGLSRRVDRLERAGWVRRERSSEDGRSIEAVLTPEGQEFFEGLSDFHLAGVRRHFAERFSEEELESLAELLGRIEKAPPADGPARPSH